MCHNTASSPSEARYTWDGDENDARDDNGDNAHMAVVRTRTITAHTMVMVMLTMMHVAVTTHTHDGGDGSINDTYPGSDHDNDVYTHIIHHRGTVVKTLTHKQKHRAVVAVRVMTTHTHLAVMIHTQLYEDDDVHAQ